MICPRCEQGDIYNVRVRATGEHLYLCRECDATWFSVEKIGVEKFFDYGAYMEECGLEPLWNELDYIEKL
ncbi:hypothetical protein SAMN05216581_4449 [Pseudomonas asplenii]|uniref:Transcription factor zinc-finger domain-containing protein n=1 Tax=Pseudomonas asplenii TaxID=53407 RepID=A0A1H6NWV7_9PSED|nr:hypothetical protein SAMN05216581_4449 [Pseudomonas fuscovaginae]